MAKVIYNDIIPFKGYQAMSFWPVIFARKSAKYLQGYVVNHESIHLRQQLEVLLTSIGILAILCLTCISWWWMILSLGIYYAWYGIEYVIRLFAFGNHQEAYRNICFEQEAFMYQMDYNYLPKDRKPFAWVKYITKKTYRRK